MPARSMRQPLLAVLVLGLTVPAARAADDPKVKLERDIVYTRAGGSELKLDLAAPAQGDGPFPAIVVIHGGAWRAGDKSNMEGAIREFAARGYVAISPQYRFCPKDVFPAQVHDVKAAVRWLKGQARQRHIDPDRIGAMGFSAGGHLALMLGVTGADDGLEGEVSAGAPDTRIHAVVNYFGPVDLGARDIPEVSRPLIRDFLGVTPSDKPDLVARASPRTYVSRDDAPILTFQGTKDPLVPHSQAIELAEAMSAAGVPGRVEIMVGAQHGWGGEEMDHTRAQTFEFFDQYLRPAAAAKPH